MKTKKVVLDILIVILFITLLILGYFLFFNQNEYYSIEKEMVEKAKEYVLKNNIKVETQEYIFIDDLDIKNTELCLKSSGVIATKIEDNIEYTPYLKCSDYESQIISNDNTYIELNGDVVELVKKGSIYLDRGFEKHKDVVVTTIGEVPDEIGAYTINYVVKESEVQKQILKRIVIVSNYDDNLVEIDKIDVPTISLMGEEKIVLVLNEEFKDPGYIAYDSKDGNLTSKVKVENNKVDSQKIGEFKIKYSVTNSKGKSTTVFRNVKVVEKRADLYITAEVKKENNETIIELKSLGDGFKNVILPDNSSSTLTINRYKVTENGKYVFEIVDAYGNEMSKTVTINNIDNELPTGECVATRGEKTYTIKVNAHDNVGTKGVIYVINDNESGLFNALEYKTIEIVEKAEAVIVDLSNNKTRLTCKISD